MRVGAVSASDVGGVCGKCVRSVWHGRYTHRPQTKVLEFLVAMLAGLPRQNDISHAAHPLDQGAAVAALGRSCSGNEQRSSHWEWAAAHKVRKIHLTLWYLVPTSFWHSVPR